MEATDIQKEIELNPNWEQVKKIIHESKYESHLGDLPDHERGQMIADLLGYPLLGSGAHRAVLEVHGYAVKIPLESIGLADNEQESFVWRDIPENLRKYLVPFVGGSKEIAIFQKAASMDFEEYLEVEEEVSDILLTLEFNGLKIDDCDEFGRNDQWGLLGKQLVILDYAESGFEQ